MSRNFELLQRLGMEQGIFQQPAAQAAAAAPERQPAAEEDLPVAVVDYVIPEDEAALEPAPELGLPEEQREEIARLVNKLFLIPATSMARVVAMAGIEPGDGCTWMTGYVAKFLASHVNRPVCVIDANLQNPALHHSFGLERGEGLAEALQSFEPIRRFGQQVWCKNLFFISAGQEVSNWSALLASDRMRSRLAELRSEFEYVLFDVPALSEGNQGVALASLVDGVVMVLRANSTRRELARKAVDDLGESQVRILGAVLNQHQEEPELVR